jgi:hypothetical protein
MTDELERRGRSASAAVHARTSGLDPGDGLETVIRRGRRPRTGAVVAVLLVAALAAPTAVWLFRGGQPDLQFGDDPPATEPATEEPRTPQATDPTEPGAGVTEPEPGGSPDPDAPATPDAGVTGGPQPLGEFGTGEVVTDGFPFGGTGVALLTDVRVAGQPGFDRIVLEFSGDAEPGYRVAYQEPPIVQDGSGDPIDVDGEAFLVVHVTPASGVDMSGTGDDGYTLTYEGPNRVTGDTGVVSEFVRTGDFEANLTWVAGLRSRAPFAVTVLTDPLRLVIDIEAG